MLNRVKLIIMIVVAGVILAIGIPMIIKDKYSELTNDSIYKKLQHERDSIVAASAIYKNQVDSLGVLVNKRDSIISNRKDSVIYITKKKNEKFIAISGYSNDELYLFFTGVKAPSIKGK